MRRCMRRSAPGRPRRGRGGSERRRSLVTASGAISGERSGIRAIRRPSGCRKACLHARSGAVPFPVHTAMGILDEAIRAHLELKRRRGATESELKQLADEAFGPPARPGEPDFPETGEEPTAQAGNGAAAEAAAESPGAPEAPVVPPAEEPDVEPGIVEEEGRPEEVPEPPLEPEQEQEVPIDALETAEHPFPEELVEPASPPDEETSPHEPLPGEEPGVPGEQELPPPGEERGEEAEDEDVLADTPEFLKDAPEDDELWFE